MKNTLIIIAALTIAISNYSFAQGQPHKTSQIRKPKQQISRKINNPRKTTRAKANSGYKPQTFNQHRRPGQPALAKANRKPTNYRKPVVRQNHQPAPRRRPKPSIRHPRRRPAPRRRPVYVPVPTYYDRHDNNRWNISLNWDTRRIFQAAQTRVVYDINGDGYISDYEIQVAQRPIAPNPIVNILPAIGFNFEF